MPAAGAGCAENVFMRELFASRARLSVAGCARRESSRAPGEKNAKRGDGHAQAAPALFLAALLLFSPAYAASIAVNLIDTAALVDENGVEIVAPGAYDFIFALDGEGGLFSGWQAAKTAFTATRCLTARASA